MASSTSLTACGDTPAVLRLGLLGGFRLSHGGDGGNEIDVTASGQQLLALLGLRGPATRSVLAGTLWPEVPEHRARASLRTAMWRLNGAGSAIADVRTGVLSLSPLVRMDIDDLTATAHEALSAADGSRVRGESAALLGRGELLPGWDQEWVVFERERLHQLRLHALEALSARLVAQGAYATALEAALESTRIDPLRESAHRAVVSVHLAEHNVAEAVRHYEGFRALLLRELGVEPSRQFSVMVRRVLV
ncbi:BTAD domain-containing putative transcriptional regulator [Streptomyces sp. NPDC059009]|uniref:AfsR/SARP family transcriptional regulator n=1 Tax=Streptomyces sp. NPDC059009 TaxID=3346694 RepID=UPI0036ABE586